MPAAAARRALTIVPVRRLAAQASAAGGSDTGRILRAGAGAALLALAAAGALVLTRVAPRVRS